MAVDNHNITVRELNTQLWKFIGTLFAIGLGAGSWYMSTTNKRLDSVVDVQNQTNLKIESFSVKTELNDLKLMKLESRADAFATRQNEFDKDLSQSNMILKNHDQLLHKHEAQIKALEK
ncbi:hypothetical protein [Wohlfahrtiimonas larvae]|uniref:Uncharacterized protein n=1 Tax=Wohlfahrtiimonas larvae TaxID=1157986 RepID=A0ABP9MJY8_9GAMM|nr:hypothetical protein [Wohlfahrtiimonas larvae]